jgi:hypothetical protein
MGTDSGEQFEKVWLLLKIGSLRFVEDGFVNLFIAKLVALEVAQQPTDDMAALLHEDVAEEDPQFFLFILKDETGLRHLKEENG